MAVVLDVVTDALRELGVLSAGEVASDDEASHGLTALNRLIDQWAAERLMIYAQTRTTFVIASGISEYTIGTDGDLDIPWPVFLDHLAYYDTAITPNQERLLTPLTNEAWAKVSTKAQTSTYPTMYWYDATFPQGVLSLWPVPTSATLNGVLYAPQQVSEFANTSVAISLPPGYRRMLVKNLALELSPSYDKPASGELVEQARDSKAVVKRANTRQMDMSIESAALGSSGSSYDIEVG